MVQPQVTVGFISATADDTQYIRGGHSLVRYPGGSVEAPTFILSPDFFSGIFAVNFWDALQKYSRNYFTILYVKGGLERNILVR